MSRKYMNDKWCVRCGRPGMTPYLDSKLQVIKGLLNEKSAAEVVVVDIGCGNGRNMNGLIKLGFDPAKVQGFDMCPDNPGVTALKLGHDKFPQADASVDLFLANYVFMFLDDAEVAQVMTEINRTAKKDAVIVIELYPAKDSRIHNDKEMADFKTLLVKGLDVGIPRSKCWFPWHNVKGKCILQLRDLPA
jgi:SAM-dependent methyltransferase